MFGRKKKEKKEKEKEKKEKEHSKTADHKPLSSEELEKLEEAGMNRGLYMFNLKRPNTKTPGNGDSGRPKSSELTHQMSLDSHLATSGASVSLKKFNKQASVSGSGSGSEASLDRSGGLTNPLAKTRDLRRISMPVIPSKQRGILKTGKEPPLIENQRRATVTMQGHPNSRRDLRETEETQEPPGSLSPVQELPANLKLPSVTPVTRVEPRALLVTRQMGGGFGFTLRRTTMLETSGSGELVQRVVHFAEPGSASRSTGLLPGDKLLEVNGRNVERMARDDIIRLIRESEEEVELVVQPVPEFAELSQRCANHPSLSQGDSSASVKTPTHSLARSGSMRFKMKSARSDEQIQKERLWLDTEPVWLVHNNGFTAARRLNDSSSSPVSTAAGTMNEGKVKIQLEDSDEKVLEVNEALIEKANPPNYDRVEDLASLRYLNESSVLHTLRQRYSNNLIHTNAGPHLIIINPMQTLSIYSDKVMQMFRGCKREDMPPHIYATAQNTYHTMLSTRRDQTIILLGRSASGKTVNARQLTQYFTTVAGSVNKIATCDKLNAMQTVVDSFVQCKTNLNSTATRCVQITTLEFEQSGLIAAANIQGVLLDKHRVARRSQGELSYDILYQLIAGADPSLRNELYLNSSDMNDNNIYIKPITDAEDKQAAILAWGRVLSAFKLLNISPDETRALLSILAAIYHLGSAGVTKGTTGNRAQFSNPTSAQLASKLLGVSSEELSRAIFQPAPSAGGMRLLRAQSPTAERAPGIITATGPDMVAMAAECMDGLVSALYNDVFTAVLFLINRNFNANYRTLNAINIVDIPGFQNPTEAGGHETGGHGATFDDFCYNYVHERLQSLFYDQNFTTLVQLYEQEYIECDLEEPSQTPSQIVSMIDRPVQQNMLRSSELDLKNADARGLLWLLDEESMFPGASEESFIDRTFVYYGDDNNKGGLVRKTNRHRHAFIIQHCLGTNPVVYNVRGWLRKARENPITKYSLPLLQDSKKNIISNLFMKIRSGTSGTVSGSVVGLDVGSATNLRRASSIKRSFTSMAAAKKRSICLQIKFQMDYLTDLLRRTELHFVFCLLPQAGAGFYDLRHPPRAEGFTSLIDNLIDVPLLRQQMRGFQLLDAIRIFRQGYPEHTIFAEFRRQFEILLRSDQRMENTLDERHAAQELLEHLEVEKSLYRIGLTQLFFRSGALAQLEACRDDRTTDTIIAFQAHCRGQVARQRIKKFKIQRLAISCIQRNVRKYLLVRQWPWWRLVTRVMPLLNVQRTEDELKNKSEELESLRHKLEKVETERNDLRQTNDRLDTRMMELTAELSGEHGASDETADLLEAETMERIRLEKENKEFKMKNSQLQNRMKDMEMELMEARIQSTQLNGHLSSDEDEVDSGMRERVSRLHRETEFQKQRLQQQFDDEMDQERASKKIVERRLAQVIEENEDSQRTISNLKKKCQKITNDLQDMRLHLESEQTRNSDLEKRQRRFDVELNKYKDETDKERQVKEKAQRDLEETRVDNFTLIQDLKDRKDEIVNHRDKIDRLEGEVRDVVSAEGKGEMAIMTLKRERRELDNKVTDMEDELDEQAGTIQQLEQSKLRLEMELEKVRKELQRENDNKDEELEEMRSANMKKMRQIEMQLEDEYDKNQAMSRDKHDLQRQIQEMGHSAPATNRDSEQRLRKDLRKTKALLKDAQIMLDDAKNSEGTKQQLKQLKRQVEDLEEINSSVQKSKKSLENEVEEQHQQIEQITRAKMELEDRVSLLSRENNEFNSRLEEADEELAEVLKKQKSLLNQVTLDHDQMMQQSLLISDLTSQREEMQEKLNQLTTRLAFMDDSMVDKTQLTRWDTKVKDLETSLDYEKLTRHRLESQLVRAKEALERVSEEKDVIVSKQSTINDENRKLHREMKDLKSDVEEVERRETEANRRKQEIEREFEEMSTVHTQAQNDLKLAFRRIADLQAALEDDLGSESDPGASSDTDHSGDEDINDWLVRHNQKPLSRDDSISSVDTVASKNSPVRSRGKRTYSMESSDMDQLM